MLEASNVSFAIGKTSLIENVSARLKPGAVVGVLGPNGAGKSTLLRLLSGELVPTTGRVLLDGRDLSSIGSAGLAGRRAVVPQSTALAFPFSVREVVALGVSVPNFASTMDDVDTAVTAALNRVELSHLSHRRYTSLSGGERQRAHLARALCQLDRMPNTSDARFLLLDEPTASLDLAHQLLVLDQVTHVASSGVGVLAVLHDINLAARFCDEVILMSNGRITRSGAPNDALRDPELSDVYACRVLTNTEPPNAAPYVLPQVCSLHRDGSGAS
ncbi:MAG: heme ABC transporter ATP-binding protein [Pseudomonadota bacterium]